MDVDGRLSNISLLLRTRTDSGSLVNICGLTRTQKFQHTSGLRIQVSKMGTLLKSGYFFTFGLFSMKTVADGRRHAAYHSKHW